MRQMHLDAIRNFEGFSERGVWDYKQVSNGYGTRAKYSGEVIDRSEAERRFKAEIEEARQLVARFAPSLDEGSTAALTSLTFNAGTSWMNAGLGAAVKAGDLDAARSIFKEYTHAGGRSLPGLVARRQAEAEWFGRDGGGQVVGPAAASMSPAGEHGLPASLDLARMRPDVASAARSVLSSASEVPPNSTQSVITIEARASHGRSGHGPLADSALYDLLAILAHLERPVERAGARGGADADRMSALLAAVVVGGAESRLAGVGESIAAGTDGIVGAQKSGNSGNAT